MKSSLQISDPAADTLKKLGTAVEILNLLQKVQSDSSFLPSLTKQLAASYALTQPEISERDAAVDTIATAKTAVSSLNAQIDTMNQQISDAKSQADSYAKSTKSAADQYAINQKAVIADKLAELKKYSNEIDDRELAVADREAAATTQEQQNASEVQGNADLLTKLNSFSQQLADRLTKVTGMEQAALTIE